MLGRGVWTHCPTCNATQSRTMSHNVPFFGRQQTCKVCKTKLENNVFVINDYVEELLPEFEYKGEKAMLSRHTCGDFPEHVQHTCFCCNKKINDCMAVLLVNNKTVPNVMMHDDCFKQWENKTVELCDDIVAAFEDWKKLNEIFGGR